MRYAIRQTNEYKSIKEKLDKTSRSIKNRRISLCATIKKFLKENPSLKQFNELILQNQNHSVSFIKKQIKKLFKNPNLKFIEKYIPFLIEYTNNRKSFNEKRKSFLKSTSSYCHKMLKSRFHKNMQLESICLIGLKDLCLSIGVYCESLFEKIKILVGVLSMSLFKNVELSENQILEFYVQNIKKIKLPYIF